MADLQILAALLPLVEFCVGASDIGSRPKAKAWLEKLVAIEGVASVIGARTSRSLPLEPF